MSAESSHYATPAARFADLAIHIAGLTFAVLGGGLLVGLSFGHGMSRSIALTVYVVAMVTMLACSTAYNFSTGRRKALLRRLDHAGIFLMIAGSYTPFTTQVLKGGWAIGMTTAVWTIAVIGILGKMFLPVRRDALWITLYMSLGWIVVIAAGPIIEGLSPIALFFLTIGGLVYSFGVIFYVKEHLVYSRPIWHGHVVTAAGLHWVAILFATVLPAIH